MGTGRNKQIGKGRPDSPGRVAVDTHGRNVWQWNDDQLDSTTIMLQSLDNSSLALEPTRKVRRTDIQAADQAGRVNSRASHPAGEQGVEGTEGISIEQTLSFRVGGGFDPYNRS